MWIAGRPYAFNDQEIWSRLFTVDLEEWTFLQVEQFDIRDVKQYMALVTNSEWYEEFASKPLLHIPRLLKLVCEIVTIETSVFEP